MPPAARVTPQLHPKPQGLAVLAPGVVDSAVPPSLSPLSTALGFPSVLSPVRVPLAPVTSPVTPALASYRSSWTGSRKFYSRILISTTRPHQLHGASYKHTGDTQTLTQGLTHLLITQDASTQRQARHRQPHTPRPPRPRGQTHTVRRKHHMP